MENFSEIINLKMIIEKFELERLKFFQDCNWDTKEIIIKNHTIYRPMISVLGIDELKSENQLNIVTGSDFKFLKSLNIQKRKFIVEKILQECNTAIIITDNLDVNEQNWRNEIKLLNKYNVPVFKTSQNSDDFIYGISNYLRKHLANCISRHGVLIEIYGEGVLLLGKSGIGKTETAIELVKRGHILVADDNVVIKRTFPNTLIGSSPNRIKHLAEIRGVGIINFRKIFGVGAIKDNASIGMIVHLERWDDNVEYERLGFEETYEKILDVQVPSITIPVTSGRNLAIILEVAAINNRQRRMDGHSMRYLVNQFYGDENF